MRYESLEDDLKKRLEFLKREYTGMASLIEMMEEGTMPEDLARIRKEKLEPLKKEISRLEAEIGRVD